MIEPVLHRGSLARRSRGSRERRDERAAARDDVVDFALRGPPVAERRALRGARDRAQRVALLGAQAARGGDELAVREAVAQRHRGARPEAVEHEQQQQRGPARERRARDVVEVAHARVVFGVTRRERRVLAQRAAREHARDAQLVHDRPRSVAITSTAPSAIKKIAHEALRHRQVAEPILDPPARTGLARAELLVEPPLDALPEAQLLIRLAQLERGERGVERLDGKRLARPAAGGCS